MLNVSEIQKVLAVALLSSLLPIFASAALNAGVVNGVWFSDPNPEAGEEVHIFTAVQNTSGETVSGTVAFLVNGNIVGTAAFTAKNNEVLSVSVPYIFEDGAHEVSSYITSSAEENVVYTIAPDTSVSVVRRAEPVAQESTADALEAATTTLAVITETVTETSESVLAQVEPVVESAAQSVESFRDAVLATSTLEAASAILAPEEDKAAPQTKKEAFEGFVESSKAIAKSEGIALWKKAAGIGLSFLALLIRFWFVLVVLIVGFAFWLLVRGRRIF